MSTLHSQYTIAVAESITCGNLMAEFGSISGCSKYYVGGINAYRIDEKVNLLGVSRDHALKTNSVSKTVCKEMAKGVSTMFGSDIGISTCGYSEPYPERDVDEAYAYGAIYDSKLDYYYVFKFKGGTLSRVEFQRHIAYFIYEKFKKLYID